MNGQRDVKQKSQIRGGMSNKMLPSPESNKQKHLKMDGWKTIFLFGRPLFRCYLVSGRLDIMSENLWTWLASNGLIQRNNDVSREINGVSWFP